MDPIHSVAFNSNLQPNSSNHAHHTHTTHDEHSSNLDISMAKSNENPGVKFIPTDVELINFYLKSKNDTMPLSVNPIYEFGFYKHTPDDISVMFRANGGDGCWIFFTQRNKKYLGGTRPDRAVAGGRGYWKAEGADKKVMNRETHVGNRKLLAYYDGKYKNGEKTDWRLHELTQKKPGPEAVKKDTMMLEDWVVCKLYKTKRSKKNRNLQIGPNHPGNYSFSMGHCEFPLRDQIIACDQIEESTSFDLVEPNQPSFSFANPAANWKDKDKVCSFPENFGEWCFDVNQQQINHNDYQGNEFDIDR